MRLIGGVTTIPIVITDRFTPNQLRNMEHTCLGASSQISSDRRGPITRTMNRLKSIILFLIALSLGALSLGCESEQRRLDTIVAAIPASTRATTAQVLKTEFDEGKITFEGSLIRAEEMLEADHADGPTFAGAVLDMAVLIEDKLPKGGEFELFWRRIGRLAYNASFAAYEQKDFDAFDSLILAGPKRWQRETYWIAYPNHEINVAYSMAYRGNARGGIGLLSNRMPMPEQYHEAIEMLKQIERQHLRQRINQQIQNENNGG
jgi:hypothetical protein